MANVVLRHVNKRFGRIEAVRDLSLAINDGEFVVLLGPSGAGKTTTLRLITGLEHPDRAVGVPRMGRAFRVARLTHHSG